MPASVLDSDRALTYVLLHGDDPSSGWTSSWLSDDEAQRLLMFLKEVIPRPTCYDLIADLERRCGPAPGQS
jgi:hypothetical protein